MARYTTLPNPPPRRWEVGSGSPVCFIEEAEAQRSETTCPRSKRVSSRARISPFLTTCLAPTFPVLTHSLAWSHPGLEWGGERALRDSEEAPPPPPPGGGGGGAPGGRGGAPPPPLPPWLGHLWELRPIPEAWGCVGGTEPDPCCSALPFPLGLIASHPLL